MYQDHFHLKQEPFSIAPDPSFLYLSSGHSEALAHLMYGFSHGGFVLITGEVGTGKTTLLRNLLKQTPDDLDVAFILNPRLTVRELLETLCEELGVAYDIDATVTVKQFIDALNKHLLSTHYSGRSTVVIIDEAQNLSPAVLEQIRLLTNLETDEKKLLRIILLGQPELADLLARQELRQLAQRITARYHLRQLNKHDSYAYVVHRLSRAGGNPHIFTLGALHRLYRLSKGIPRLINIIADRALLGAYVEDNQRVSARVVSRAADEVLGRQPRLRIWAATTVFCIGLAGVAWAYFDPLAAIERKSSETLARTDPRATISQASAPAAIVATIEATTETTNDAITPVSSDREFASHLASDLAGDPSRSPSLNPSPNDEPAAPAANEPAAPAAASRTTAPGASRTLISRPADSTYSAQRRAYAAVFDRWGVDYLDTLTDLIPCDFAPSAGLQCLSRHGSWSDIERLNLPVVLELWDDQPSPYYVALTQLGEATLTLHIGEATITATPRDLRDLWYGAYVVLWQTPPGYYGSLRQGDHHQTVSWLRQQLAVLGTPSTADDAQFFGPRLHAAVVEFQLAEGLLTDGIVGPATWIRLAERLALPAPKLGS